MLRSTLSAFALLTLLCPTVSMAQSDDTASAEPASATTASDTELLTEEELRTLVGPVALYPDTLLIQVLVAATFPLEVVKADRYLSDNTETDPEELKPEIEAQGWDDSVTVLATAFPDVLTDMAVHVEWTEAMGTAMLAQSDDVMNAVQDMRAIAAENGTLESGEEQTVEVTQEAGDQNITIQPADPQTVYVPQYDPNTVYVQDNTGDLVTAGLVTFGTVALINEIFDDDDDWYGYWGCRSCGGWGGGPIINNPNVDIDIDGDVNIGDRPDIGWKPDEKRRDDARDKIADHRDPERAGTLPVNKPDRGDEMRDRLSKSTGASDISRPDVSRSEIDRTKAKANAQKSRSSPEARKAAVDRTKARAPDASSRVQKAKPAAKPKAPVKAKPAAKKAAAKRPSGQGQAVKKRGGGSKAKAGGARGRASAGRRR